MSMDSLASGVDAATLMRRILALGIPPLGSDFGSSHRSERQRDPTPQSPTPDHANRARDWRPKVGGVVVATISEHLQSDEARFGTPALNALGQSMEHSSAVNRIAVATHSQFFVTASSDSTSRVWLTNQLETTPTPKSCAVYSGQSGRILDACTLDNTNSVCTASENGSVHIWKVDLATVPKSNRGKSLTEVRTVNPSEGAVLSIAPYSTDSGSMLVYGTQKGHIHCWDLRCQEEPWVLKIPPELGYLTNLAAGTGADKQWMCTGTSRGFLALWDLRFQTMSKLWRHASHGPIHRLATCARLPEDGEHAPAQPLAFVAAGNNEVSVWNLSTGGQCRRCFRALSPQDHSLHTEPLPTLEEIPLPSHPSSPIFSLASQLGMLRSPPPSSEHAVRAIMGRISANGNSYVITGGTDKHIRFWDFSTPSKCFTISGLRPGQVWTNLL